ncbi:penicillin-binding protein 2 [Paenibacillus sp. CF384]|uniref:peptidoglycan D,D-transpeptidase FtsI family protein n=1 Tax=Paenibacillus sp. CF384 TaxID=1884382 RepID=UPI000898A750|nr:penicillin-binding transpeptidase domain-containing protein [Paenibacillus sp. CF384]SDX18492.1 Cell division protein FtsI/penicillin-binding protein 2 [Paenibacillus sp. CF384]
MSRERRRSRQQRIFILLLMLSAMVLLFVLRIGWLQLMPSAPVTARSSDWKEESVAQRERTLVLDTGRGDFYDRSGRPLTGETYEALAVFPLQMKSRTDNPKEIGELAKALGMQSSTLTQWLEKLTEPAFWQREGEGLPHRLSAKQLAAIDALHINGVRVLPYHNRYPSAFSVMHAVGYISQHPELLRVDYSKRLKEHTMSLSDRTGGAGLERSLDPLLQGTGPTAVSYFTDGTDKPMHGLNLRLVSPNNPYYPIKVMTTMDLSLQNQLENYVDHIGLKEGAVVVLDTANGDIITMISRPQLAISSIDATGLDAANHAIRAATPGSIFKIVTEAAVLESRVSGEGEQFYCNGNYGRYGLHCWKDGGHGHVTLQDAFAGSCNVVFAELAERLSARQFLVTADQLGIARQIGWSSKGPFAPLGRPLRQFQEEEAGNVFAHPPGARDGGQLAQTGIGQRDVKLSPLQAANLIVTLLHEGRVQETRLVSEIRYGNGQLLAKLPNQSSPSQYGRIHARTARTLLRSMEAVVNYGTGKGIRNGIWAVAGKSGTAQIRRGDRERLNQWFVGYGPAERPRYAVAVLAENRTPGTSNQATVIFRGVMDILAKQPQQKQKR